MPYLVTTVIVFANAHRVEGRVLYVGERVPCERLANAVNRVFDQTPPIRGIAWHFAQAVENSRGLEVGDKWQIEPMPIAGVC